jgi:hypothetical protein
MIFTGFARFASSTGDTGFHGNLVADFEGGHFRADFAYDAGRFVAEDHGFAHDEGADCAVFPVVDL